MQRFARTCLPALCLSLLLSACLGPIPELYPEDPDERPIPVYLTAHGWHVGLVLKVQYLENHFDQPDAFPPGRYLEFGWGDAGYYPHPDPGLPQLLRAALLPTASVLHIAGFERHPTEQFPGSQVIRLQLSEAGHRAMADFVIDRLQLDPQGQVIPLGDGLYAESRFFEAEGRYFFPLTSNWWTARALREAGLAITPLLSFRQQNIMRQAGRSGEVLQ